MKTKTGEFSGLPLYSVDGVAWYRTPEKAAEVYRRKQELQAKHSNQERAA